MPLLENEPSTRERDIAIHNFTASFALVGGLLALAAMIFLGSCLRS